MVEGTRNTRTNVVLPTTVLVIGLAQAVLVALALARILDPDFTTFGPIGVLSGFGMAAIGLVAARYLRWRRPTLRRFGWLGVVSGLLTGAVWASVLGGTFYTTDLVRVAIVIASDCLFAIVLVASVRLADQKVALPGLSVMAAIMSVRAATELVLSGLLLLQPDAGPGQNVLVVVLAVGVLIGWIVLAVWEIVVGAWLIRIGRVSAAGLAARP